MVRKIVIDKAIPFIEPLFGSLGDVVAVASEEISPALVKEADALIVRSVTRVDQHLLASSNIGFVGTATIGTEHIDLQWLTRNNTAMASAPGCNAVAVVQYVLSAISYWLKQRGLAFEELTVGIVGVGEIGSRLSRALTYLGANCVLCDPPLTDRGELPESQSLTYLADRCDVISLHTPLTTSGQYPTQGLLDQGFFERLNTRSLLINAARGGLIKEEPLKDWINLGGSVVLDVWPHEPTIDKELLSGVILGTPHIAGYSIEGKCTASYQIYQALAKHWREPSQVSIEHLYDLPQSLDLTTLDRPEDWFLQSYSISKDADQLKSEYRKHGATGFKQLRNGYSFRRDFSGQIWRGNEQARALGALLKAL